MGQILTKYKQGALGWAEFADAIFDPANAIRVYNDFIETGAITASTTSGTAVQGSGVSIVSTHAATNLGNITINSAHGGTVSLTQNATTTANDNMAMTSINDFWTVAPGRRGYFECRVSGTAMVNGFCVGLTSSGPAGSVWNTSAIAAAADSILIGRDAGTDTVTGGVVSRTLQLSVRGSNGSMVETAMVLPAAISATTTYTLGIFIDGTQVQGYVNGVKTGAVTKYDNSSGTPGPMCWYLSTNAPSTSPFVLTCDYVAFAGTR